uniref:Coenzyme Q-binding protein COQ10 START domain-containing protein n=1 Tax=Solanum tuberosum TaxID=4113 RepID=M1AVS4_SOLTU
MVDGDFKKFEGKWSVRVGTRSSTAILSYEVSVIPRFNFPAIFLERIFRSDLPVNRQALSCRAENNYQGYQSVTKEEPGSYLISTKTDIDHVISHENKSSGEHLKVKFVKATFGRSTPVTSNENGGVHRCVVASITVKAPVREEGCKGLLYMVLHARVVLDLSELIVQEISFEQVEGDFDSFEGKWILEQLGSHHTLLKYSVESKMHKNSFLSEAIMEEVIYEDLPSNLCAIRDYIEERETEKPLEKFNHDEFREASVSSSMKDSSVYYDRQAGQNSDSSSLHSPRQRPKVSGLQRDIEVLKAELLAFISEHGQEGFMPMRKQLRKHGIVDIEKAITRMGGFRRISSLMNLSLAYKHRKPKVYWDSLENLQEEVS